MIFMGKSMVSGFDFPNKNQSIDCLYPVSPNSTKKHWETVQDWVAPVSPQGFQLFGCSCQASFLGVRTVLTCIYHIWLVVDLPSEKLT